MIARALLVGLATAVLVPLQANAQDLVQEALDRGRNRRSARPRAGGRTYRPAGFGSAAISMSRSPGRSTA